jgi:hypothetical protein
MAMQSYGTAPSRNKMNAAGLINREMMKQEGLKMAAKKKPAPKKPVVTKKKGKK